MSTGHTRVTLTVGSGHTKACLVWCNKLPAEASVLQDVELINKAVEVVKVNESQRANIVRENESQKANTFNIRKWFNKSRRKDKDATTPTSQEDARPYLDDDFVQERFLDVDVLALVIIPQGVDHCEWLATNTKAFFDHVNLMYGCLAEYCRSSSCTAMTGPGSLQYQWVDDRGKKCKCTAPQYIDYVMSFSQKCIYDESVFPTKYGNVFPLTFESTVRKIARLLLHVFAHVYAAHSADVLLLKLHAHFNTVYYHFHLFLRQFALVDDREMEALDDLFQRLHHHATRKVQFDSATGAEAPPPAEGSNADDTAKSPEQSRLLGRSKENVSGSSRSGTYQTLTAVT